MRCSLIVHGGAWNMPDEAVEPSRSGVLKALTQGWEALRNGAEAVDVVEQVIRHLEDDPVFDAGRGSHLNREGRVEMDASIMCGRDLTAGAVAAIQCVRHPISVARRVMEDSPHVMLVGEGAHVFAENLDLEVCDIRDLLVGREFERYERVRAGERDLIEAEFGAPVPPDEGPMGTVGAVAFDQRGRLAAATSTGGTQDKLPGRVGDTPVIGAGTYADDRAGAASATGWGEGIMRVLLTRTAIDHLISDCDPAEAGRRALATLGRVGGRGGLILLDRGGRPAAVFNTPRMARGWATHDDGPHAAVNRTDRNP